MISQRAYLDRLRKFEAAVRDHEMRGCQHPEDVPGIERRYERTKKALLDAAPPKHIQIGARP